MHCACLLVSKKTCNVHKKGNLRMRMGSETEVISPIMAKLEMAKKFNFMPYDSEFLPLTKAKRKKIPKGLHIAKFFQNKCLEKITLASGFFCHFTDCNNKRNGFRQARPFLIFFLFIEFLSHKLPQFSKLFSIICAAVSSS